MADIWRKPRVRSPRGWPISLLPLLLPTLAGRSARTVGFNYFESVLIRLCISATRVGGDRCGESLHRCAWRAAHRWVAFRSLKAMS